jgi:hypothetical protein
MWDLAPGIVGSAVIVIDPYAAVGKLDRIGFTQQNHSGPVKPGNRMGISGGYIVIEKTCSGSRRQALNVK